MSEHLRRFNDDESGISAHEVESRKTRRYPGTKESVIYKSTWLNSSLFRIGATRRDKKTGAELERAKIFFARVPDTLECEQSEETQEVIRLEYSKEICGGTLEKVHTFFSGYRQERSYSLSYGLDHPSIHECGAVYDTEGRLQMVRIGGMLPEEEEEDGWVEGEIVFDPEIPGAAKSIQFVNGDEKEHQMNEDETQHLADIALYRFVKGEDGTPYLHIKGIGEAEGFNELFPFPQSIDMDQKYHLLMQSKTIQEIVDEIEDSQHESDNGSSHDN